MNCPVCNERWPDDAARCVCGYNFETRDPSYAIQRLTREARYGNRLWFSGMAAMIVLPVVMFGIPFPWSVVAALVEGGLAAMWIVQGLIVGDRANKKLAAAKQLVQLPAARLIER